MRRAIGLGALSGAVLALLGCPPSGVGDPCSPENVPQGGFRGSEVYIETNSVQCRTRVCLVYRYDGDPNRPIQCLQLLDVCCEGGGCSADGACGAVQECCEEAGAPGCSDLVQVRKYWETDAPSSNLEEVNRRVFCSCRCEANTPGLQTCACPEGYECMPLVGGSYCVRRELVCEEPPPGFDTSKCPNPSPSS